MEEAAAPTVTLESVFVTATIDTKEKQEVVTIDIPGAFLHADNEDYVIMKMNGLLADISEIRNDKKGEAGFISATAKGIIRHDEERPAIL